MRSGGRRTPSSIASSAARRDGLDAAADQYPYTAAATTLSTILPPPILALSIEDAGAAIRDPRQPPRHPRPHASGLSGWENVTARSRLGGHRHLAQRVPSRLERPLPRRPSPTTLGGDPAELALDVLADDRLSVDIVIHCMAEPDVETIMRVPWIGVCTDAEGRRPDHPILDEGVPHPRAYGSTARVLGHYVRDRGIAPPRDRGREAERRARRARRPPGSGAGPGGRRTPTSWCSTPRPSPTSRRTSGRRVHPAGHPRRDRERPRGRARRPGDRGAPRPPPAAGRMTLAAAAATETEALARLPGGELRYMLRRSPRSRRLRVTILPDRGVVVSIPGRRAARAGRARSRS